MSTTVVEINVIHTYRAIRDKLMDDITVTTIFIGKLKPADEAAVHNMN